MPIVLLTNEERLGTTVAGRYRLDSVLGVGGMAVVFRAKHTWTGRDVAVKFLDPRRTKDVALASRRFLKEGRLIGALKHPNIVQVLDMGRDEHGIVFQVLELLKGHTLAARLDEDGRLTVQETIDVMFPMMDALTAAHEMDIVHRDVKPENIFISFDESGAMVPKLLDFGVAKGLEDEEHGNLTREGSVLGTPYYMAPEQARGASTVSAPADIFSLAAVTYECLAGQLPFGDQDPAAYAVKLMSSDAPSIRERVTRLDEDLAAAVDSGLCKDPASRPQTMLDFRRSVSRAGKAAGFTIPPPAVYTPQGRAQLLAQADGDPAETLADDTLLSDFLAGGRPSPPPGTSFVFKALVGVLGALAIALGFFLAGGIAGPEAQVPPTAESALLGNEPPLGSASPATAPAQGQAEAHIEEAAEVEGVEDGLEVGVAEVPTEPESVGLLAGADDERGAPRRIGVRRRVSQSTTATATTTAADPDPTTLANAPADASNQERPQPQMTSPDMSMRSRDVPHVVREF